MQDCRCQRCNKLLFRGVFNQIEIKCPRCKFIIVSNAKEHPTEKHSSGQREQIPRIDSP